MPLAGGPLAILADRVQAAEMAVGATNVYWTIFSAPWQAAVMALAKGCEAGVCKGR